MQQTDAQTLKLSNSDERRVDMLICGGGISGLSLAAWLRRGGREVAVLDKNARPGGVIGTVRRDGFIFERGPNTILDKYESFEALIAWAGLESEIIRVPLRTQKRHVWLGGRLHEVPTSPLAFLKSPLLPRADKLALLKEPFVPPVQGDETVAAFVRRRLGAAWLRNLVTPMVSGIWAGDPERMSIAHSFPIMKKMERAGGSLVWGAFKHMRKMARERRAGGGARRRVKNLVSFRDGLDRLPAALAEKLGGRYQSATRILEIEPNEGGGGFRVHAECGGEAQFWIARELVIAAEADQAARWLEGFDLDLALTLRSFPYNRLAVVALGLKANEARLPEGFGFLAPRGEGVRMLGAIVNSNFLPGRAPAGCAALTIFIGGDLDPEAAELSDEQLTETVRRDLKTTIGWSGPIQGLWIERWPRAIPQYDMGHAARLTAIETAERRWPGLHLVGNWRGGVSIGDRVETTRALAQRMMNLKNLAAGAGEQTRGQR